MSIGTLRWALSWASLIHFTTHVQFYGIQWNVIFISPSNFFSWSSLTKILYLSSVPGALNFSPFHLPLASQPNNTASDEEFKLWRLLLCNFHHSYVASSFLFAQILPTTFLTSLFACNKGKSSQLTSFLSNYLLLSGYLVSVPSIEFM
jgi:hypothetical protein